MVRDENGDLQSVVSYSMKLIKIYVGLNNAPTSSRDLDPARLFTPQWIRYIANQLGDRSFQPGSTEPAVLLLPRIRSSWVSDRTFTPDLSIIRVDRDIVFIPGVVAPICLPSGSMQDDDAGGAAAAGPGHVYVAGWGASHAQCDSDGSGPAPHRACKFPFVFGDGDRPRSGCSHDETPSASNPVCNQFYAWAAASKDASDFAVDSKEASYFIFFWDDVSGSVQTTACYSRYPGASGWCGTCDPGATEGTPGYCDPVDGKKSYRFAVPRVRRGRQGSTKGLFPVSTDSFRPASGAETARPSWDANWGFCTDWCNKFQSVAKTLMETKLDLLEPEACRKLGADMSVDTSIEFCAGKKRPYPMVARFKRLKDPASGQYFFEHQGARPNYFGADSAGLDFYLGGTDACQGRSCQPPP